MSGSGMFTAGVGMITSAMKMNEARNMRRKAQNFIDNFEPEPLSNKFSDVQVSTLGAEMQAEESAVDLANITERASGGGMRGIMGVTQTAQANRDKVMEQVGAGLDAKQKELDILSANDEIRIEAIKEKRSQEELAGYGKLLDIAMNDEKQAMGSMVSSVGSMGSSMGGGSMGGGVGGSMGSTLNSGGYTSGSGGFGIGKQEGIQGL